jgi:hypothetical protein
MVQGSATRHDINEPVTITSTAAAGLCLLMTEDFVNDNSIFRTKRKFFATQAEGLGGQSANDTIRL